MSSSSGPEPTPTNARPRVRPLAVLAVGLLIAVLSVVAPLGAPAASAATGSCRSVSGAPAATGGPQRATVVVDTGSGPIWSACISFSGTISGVDALELAKAQIPGLSPVYDIYAGQGRAVCRLRGVGNDPPDCLGKSVEYWGYFRNGRYSSAGAGAVRVRDGDVEGWRWGSSGATPRQATDGYEAAAYVAPPTTAAPTTAPSATAPPTTRPPSPTVAPRAPTGSPADAVPAPGGSAGSPALPGASGGATTTTAPAAGGASSSTSTSTSTSSTTVVPGRAAASQPGSADASGGELGERAEGGDELAAGVPGSPGGPSLDEGDDGSNLGSLAAFAAALLAVVGIGLVLRRRRTTAA